jgi:hypothetical protein
MPDKSVLNALDWGKVEAHYRSRVNVSRQLLRLLDDGKVTAFAELAIGSTDNTGNYSAAEHRSIRPGIARNPNWTGRVYKLAEQFRTLKSADNVRNLITGADINWLQIGVGSEMSCMVNPDVCWVCNVRTIWIHLAWTENPGKAEEQLRLYRASSSESEMAYMRWAEVYHPLLRETLIEVAEEGASRAKAAGVIPKGKLFLWADAIASYAFDGYHGKK